MPTLSRFFTTTTLFIFVLTSLCQGAGIADLNSTLSSAMQKLVDDKVISGVVCLVETRDGKNVTVTTGYSDLANKKPMSPDSLFWIASMTKPVTSVAVLLLQDEGKLNVDDPVEKYLPEFKKQWLVKESTKEQQTLVPAPRPITLRDLL
ncbi:MAG: hypothetical protein JWM04_794, partial [Verrucomicrobiales bacterium]|nr:hypothetical protein [Verrucomicrobiales bacterium]